MVVKTETLSGDLCDLRSLCTVIDCGGITRAAELLGETKGSISRRITRLEKQLGVKLLNRSSRAVSATEAGMAFYHRSLQALSVLDEGAMELRDAHQVPSGLLRLTMPLDVGNAIVSPLIAEFMAYYPEIRVDVTLSERLLDLKTHQIDIALRVAQTLPDADYLFQRLIPIGLQLFASSQYLERHGHPSHPDDLERHAMLCHHSFPGRKPLVCTRGNHRLQIKLRPRTIANEFTFLQAMAIAGTGIAVLPDFIGKTEQLTPVLSDWSLAGPGYLYLLYEGWRLLPAKVTYFRDFICDRLAST